jgi:hypothetical protein
MFAGGKGGERLLDVHLVRRRDVDDIHIRRAIQRAVIVVAIDFGDPPSLGRSPGILRRAANGGDLHAEAFEGFDVDGPNETGPDDTGAKVMEGSHGELVLESEFVRETREGALSGRRQ